MSDVKRFVRDRDEAFIDFVETGSTVKVRKQPVLEELDELQ